MNPKLHVPLHIPTDASLLSQPDLPLIHRDLSWLQFNERVLAEARISAANPLLERLKFLAISASNLDEFFMIRFASAPREQCPLRDSILNRVAKFVVRQTETFELLAMDLSYGGIHLVAEAPPLSPAANLGKEIFENEIRPHLPQPKVFDESVLPKIQNLELVVVCDDQFITLPRSLPFVYVSAASNGDLFCFFIDDLIVSHWRPQNDTSLTPFLFRITRDSDFSVDLGHEDSGSVPHVVRRRLSSREVGHPVRLQFVGNPSAEEIERLRESLKLQPNEIFPTPPTLCLQSLWTIVNAVPHNHASPLPLRYPPLQQQIPQPFLEPEHLFDVLKQRDLLLQHPYDSFEAYVRWIQAACKDPDVIMIEQTAYRMDTLSSIVEALKSAAPHKRVRVTIELRARFDEDNNLKIAEELKAAGVEVTFGFGNLKLHAKVALVTRREGDELKHYTHLSTGNYKATTARLYTDLAIITSHPEIGADARHFFDAVSSGKVPKTFSYLVPAPAKLHLKLLQLIRRETKAAQNGDRGRIFVKVNALVDPAAVQALYEASQAGVQIDLVVRGACSLIPGIKGLSENIRVISIVDRFLEHSRIYFFENSKAMYLSSADWMPRNFFSRLELAFPVLDSVIYGYFKDTIIPTYLGDTVKAKELTAQGTWKRRSPLKDRSAFAGYRPLRSQFSFEELARRNYAGTMLNPDAPTSILHPPITISNVDEILNCTFH